MPKIERPKTTFTEEDHKYTVEGKESVSISTVAKIGNTEAFSIGAAWGFKLGYTGTNEIYSPTGFSMSDQELREELKRKKKTPWSKTKEGADRGNWTHEVFEELAQDGEVRMLSKIPKEYRGHAQAIFNWYIDYRPEFVAVEVQVASKLGFAGRYDARCLIEEMGLCLVDLKTTKAIYPEQHYPQLAGYELASIEMGFPPTDAQYILRTNPDGTYEFGEETKSYATAEDFFNYFAAMRSVMKLRQLDKARKRGKIGRKKREATKGK